MTKITLLTVGDELLIGQVVDTNAAFMARELNLQGMEVQRKWTIADTLDEIQGALKAAFVDSDVVLMTGGLGPTKDDVTKKALADYYGVGMRFDESTWERIQALFRKFGRSTTPAHREQCYMPENAELLTNKMGTAPGMWLEQAGKVVVSMPGVPYEMIYLMREEVLPRLAKSFPGSPIAHRTILTIGEGESRLAAKIEDIEDRLPDHLKLAYLPGLGRVRIRLTGRHQDAEQLAQDLQQFGDEIRERLARFVFGEGTTTIEEQVGALLKAKGLSLGTAESCTGGLLAHQITTVPGSSAYFEGSIVSYSNDLKMKLLNVDSATLEAHGAVSEATVKEMVNGALDTLGVDVAVSISGIAGPDGGTPEKPVGTIWIAVGDRTKTKTQLVQAGKNRQQNVNFAVSRALGLLWNFIR